MIADLFNTTEELVESLKDGKVDGILVDMYVPTKRKELFNGTWFEMVELIKCQSLHGIVLKHEAVMLAKVIEEMVSEDNVQSKFLMDGKEDEEEEEVCYSQLEPKVQDS